MKEQKKTLPIKKATRWRHRVLFVLSVSLLAPGLVRAEQKSEALFPLCKEMAKGETLTLPMGGRAVFYYQEQDMNMESIRLTVPPVPLPPEMAGLIPDSFTLDYNGPVYGGGMTLVTGYKSAWASLDANYTWADLNLSDSSISTLTVSPRVGMDGSLGGMNGGVWVGAMCQDTEEKQVGTVNFPLMNGVVIPAEYDVRSKADAAWNMLAGARWKINCHWNGLVEAGFLGRAQAMASLEYRF